MTKPGMATTPIRVAIIGAGPAGFYTAEHLLKQSQYTIEVDLFDRLPTPYGLVRGGVAPDHQKIKSVTKAYERIAKTPGFRYFGYVEYGKDVRIEDLKSYYHQIVFATGTQTGKLLDIPGAELDGSFPASDFVAWYNGHPDYRDLKFDLTRQRVAVIGMGNVAVDVARILCLTPEELGRTDIADYALDALRHSHIKEVTILGRRGPAQAAFTTPEVKELGNLEGTDVIVLPQEAELGALSQADLDERPDQAVLRKVELIQEFAKNSPVGKHRQLTIRFLVSPVEIKGDEDNHVTGIRLEKNELFKTDAGTLRPRSAGQFEDMPVDLVFHSIGYKGVSLPGIPYNARWGVIPNQNGRVIDPDGGQPLKGIYTAGWIKRGPSGVIGTNKLDASETVNCMLEDLEKGNVLEPAFPESCKVLEMIRKHQPEYVPFDDWLHLDQVEVERGEAENRPRVKFTVIENMLSELDEEKSA